MDKTLLKGLQVLELLTRAQDKMRITDVADSLELTRSNAYRALRTLEKAGYVKQDPVGKTFSPSLKLWELGTQVIGKLDLRATAAPILRELADRSRETVHLAVRDRFEVIYIDKIDSLEPVSSYTRLGGRAPAYCVATGKALLSLLNTEELQPLWEQLEKHSPNTIVDQEALLDELAKTKQRGYAINHGEWRESVWGFAAPIGGADNYFAAAVGVSGPQYRIDSGDRPNELIELVQWAARRISEATT